MATTLAADPALYIPDLVLPCDPCKIRSAPGAILTAASGRQYILGYRISTGGSATIFTAQLVGSNLKYALRMITETKRLAREMVILEAAIGNPYALQMVDHGQWGTVPWVATELLTGGEVGSHFSCNVGARTDEQVAWVGAQIASCFERFSGDITHRDIKPSNIMIRVGADKSLGFVPGDSVRGFRAIVIDFGIAGDVGIAAGAIPTKVTRTNQALGTLAYLSPEVCVGGARTADFRADIYGLGCVLYELRTDEFIVKDDAIQQKVMEQHISEPMPNHPEIQGHMKKLIRKMVSKHTYDRHGSWKEVRQECEFICGKKIDL